MLRTRIDHAAAACLVLALAGCGESPLGVDEAANGPSRAASFAGTETIDFEGLPAGTHLFSVNGNGGTGPILVHGRNPNLRPNTAVIFDTANPSGGDCDLGTPNQAFGGPGCGTLVGPGTPYVNDTSQGKAVIVAVNLRDLDNDGLVDDPDDINQTALDGVWVAFSFQNVGPQTMQCLTVVDIDGNAPNPRVEMYASDSTLIATVPIPNDMPDNGKAVVDLGGTQGVQLVVVHLQGSGAIDDLVFGEPQEPELGQVGDFVWCDLNDDGVQGPGEPGIAGVTVDMTCVAGDGSTFTVSTSTDANGLYLFTDVPAGHCDVTVDVSTAPADKDPGTHCPTTISLELGEGESFLDADFCFVERPPVGSEGCSPGYWKNHTDSWPPTGYATGQTLDSVFSEVAAYPSISSATLAEALRFKGGSGTIGGARNLMRHAVAALLNSSHPGTAYPRTQAALILDVNDALASGDRDTMLNLKDGLDTDNNLGCPLN